MIRPAAATVLVAAAGVVGAPSPAVAAACTSDSGVTVVVDFHELGGGVDQDCVADQGQADDLFRAAGHTLENVRGQAFVCRVDGLPSAEQEACARTPPSDAYWGLWWSDGTDGTWTYSSQSTYALDVPDGGAVAFSWNGSAGQARPGVAPPRHERQPEPAPTKSPSGGGQTGGTAPGGSTPSSGGASATPDEEPSASEQPREPRESQRESKRERSEDGRGKKGKKDEAEDEPTAEPSDEPSEEPVTVAEPPATSSDGLPVWVGPAAAGGALAVAGLAAYLRRRAA